MNTKQIKTAILGTYFSIALFLFAVVAVLNAVCTERATRLGCFCRIYIIKIKNNKKFTEPYRKEINNNIIDKRNKKMYNEYTKGSNIAKYYEKEIPSLK